MAIYKWIISTKLIKKTLILVLDRHDLKLLSSTQIKGWWFITQDLPCWEKQDRFNKSKSMHLHCFLTVP
jgi:hypothetical protein